MIIWTILVTIPLPGMLSEKNKCRKQSQIEMRQHGSRKNTDLRSVLAYEPTRYMYIPGVSTTSTTLRFWGRLQNTSFLGTFDTFWGRFMQKGLLSSKQVLAIYTLLS